MSQILEMLSNLRASQIVRPRILKYVFHADEREEVWDERPARIPSALCPAVFFGQRWSEAVIFFLTIFLISAIRVHHGFREKTNSGN